MTDVESKAGNAGCQRSTGRKLLWNDNPNRRAASFRALDADVATQQTRPFLDAQQAQPSNATLYSGRVEPAAIVGNRERQFAVRPPKCHPNPPRAAVADGVPQRLLR
jgi:hypothetical protein